MTLLLLALLAPQESAEALKPLEFMVGTWTGQGTFDNGIAYTEERRFEKMLGGSFLREEYTLRAGDKVVWAATTIIGYDSEKKRLVIFGFGQSGAIARMECVDREKKDTWVFEGRAVGPGVAQDERGTMVKNDDDTMTLTLETKKGDRYESSGKHVYKRKK